ncbi:hypothetical protein BDP81DRAFT_439453 [Colletotrichum phormii]|uniref:Uncharacterized protein n=1 Tax=Colletotrichum phormii TaxID=359342 RepID=A0AAI9ZH96_9PEZI|nr:uncharacterized protein BDP81DRAFT_439453 [Colletotrichum phormii]KAK1623391.1 hypothetical protein BDP81DRAFT_439453 [Colletotrichum phormii]
MLAVRAPYPYESTRILAVIHSALHFCISVSYFLPHRHVSFTSPYLFIPFVVTNQPIHHMSDCHVHRYAIAHTLNREYTAIKYLGCNHNHHNLADVRFLFVLAGNWEWEASRGDWKRECRLAPELSDESLVSQSVSPSAPPAPCHVHGMAHVPS